MGYGHAQPLLWRSESLRIRSRSRDLRLGASPDDHGGVIFLDVRDRTGVLQVYLTQTKRRASPAADSVRNEYVLMAKGKAARPEWDREPRYAHR